MKLAFMKTVLAILLFSTVSGFAGNAQAIARTIAAFNYAQRADVKDFIDEMVREYGFDRNDLEIKFAAAKRLDTVLETIAKPAEKELTWGQYRPIFVTSKRSSLGKAFMQKYRETLNRAEKEFGVPAEIITAIIGVETYYGRLTGKYSVFDSLTTLGFDYPPRSAFFKSELKQFLLLSKEENISVDEMTGSYAGAMGMPQFIPSSYRHYAVDFDGDGKRDLWNSVPDVIGSVANYFSEHGWKQGETVTHPVTVNNTSILNDKNTLKPYVTVKQLKQQHVMLNTKPSAQQPKDDQLATLLTLEGENGDEHWIGLRNFYVITRYNRSELYAMAVFQLSEMLKN
ncbi:MAG: lytic murein transglycosylase B [Gammaproteobacteria bacterium]|nr:lytic murein transglycosylase B [Gammaproteobacteria bacterium]